MGKKLEVGDLVELKRYGILERAGIEEDWSDWDSIEDIFDDILPGMPMIITGFDPHDKNWIQVMHVELGKEYHARRQNIRRMKG